MTKTAQDIIAGVEVLTIVTECYGGGGPGGTDKRGETKMTVLVGESGAMSIINAINAAGFVIVSNDALKAGSEAAGGSTSQRSDGDRAARACETYKSAGASQAEPGERLRPTCGEPVPSPARCRDSAAQDAQPSRLPRCHPSRSCSGNSASASIARLSQHPVSSTTIASPQVAVSRIRQHCTKKAPPESGAKFATLGSLPYSAADAGEVTDALVGALPDALFQLRPRLPGVPALLKLRLGLIQGRHARDRTVDGQRDRNHLNFFWAAAGLIDKCSIKCINRVASCSTGPRSRGHLPGSGLP